MRRGWLVILLLSLPLSAMADGVVIPPTAFPASVSIPDQRALLYWSNGVERLAIDTRFVGQGTNFAWVVPLPAKPVIEESTSGLFPTLEYIFRPTLIHNVFPLYSILLFCLGIGYLCLYVRKNTPSRPSDTVISMLAALVLLPLSGCFAFGLCIFLPYAIWRVRTGREGVLVVLFFIMFAIVMSAMLLPALMSMAPVPVPASQVSILGSERIGAYDTTTLSAKDPGALLGWLKENNYAPLPGTGNVISNYVRRGWIFIAARLHRDAGEKGSAFAPPLCFTFPADKAVYPMQLTGIGVTSLQVELFVFGPSQAEANYFHADVCKTPDFPDAQQKYRRTGPLWIVHPLLGKWVSGSSAATKLSATLSPAQMSEDVEIRWIPFAEKQKTIYSNEGAAFTGLNWGAGVFAACLLVGCIVTTLKRDWQPQLKQFTTCVAMVAIAVGTVVFVALPRINVRLVRMARFQARQNVNRLMTSYSEAIEKGLSPRQAQSAVSLAAATNVNIFLGGSIREEDSPGNYIFRPSTNGADFIWFDADGGEHKDW